jgi:hypothetical protein
VAYGNLEELRKRRGQNSVAETIRDALVVRTMLERQAEQGFSQVMVRDPDTNKIRPLELDDGRLD